MNRPAELLIQYVNRESGNIPPDLAALINAALIPTFTQHHRRKLRDERICQAAALLGGSLEAIADRLAELSRRCRRATDEITALILEAARYAKLPESARHYRRIIEGF